ncbi:uncharacterized [Tachysurus ichikawai]
MELDEVLLLLQSQQVQMTEGKGGAACCLSGLCALPLLIPSSLQAHRLLPHDSPATLGAESTLSDYRAAILSLMSSE